MFAEQSGSLIAPYKLGSDGRLRPYLLLALLGVKPGLEVEILSLVDTGADRSVLPFEIEPVFVGGLNALWGRADLMMNFTISAPEKARELTLQPN